MDMQALFNAMNDMGNATRANYHLTLGAAISEAEKLPDDMPLRFDWIEASPQSPHSYRGYYSDLAFENCEGVGTVGPFLRECREALGQTFEGYKGGDFTMGERTPLWAAAYGCCGRAIVGLAVVDGTAVLLTKDID